MSKVLILGTTGMLGSAVEKVFLTEKSHVVVSTSRSVNSNQVFFDASTGSIETLLNDTEPDWIINCIGTIKPYIDERSYASIENALRINSLFPHKLASALNNREIKVIQIATDCVYSGAHGQYDESQKHDAIDVYGKTKSLGEVASNAFIHLRASIIGPEVGRSTSLLEWILGQKQNAEINGYTDHLWNGLTTHHFGKLSLAIVSNNLDLSGVHHIIPGDIVSKAELLKSIAQVYGREDIKISPTVSSSSIDRTLASLEIETSNQIWKLAEYQKAPTVHQMVQEQYSFNLLHK